MLVPCTKCPNDAICRQASRDLKPTLCEPDAPPTPLEVMQTLIEFKSADLVAACGITLTHANKHIQKALAAKQIVKLTPSRGCVPATYRARSSAQL